MSMIDKIKNWFKRNSTKQLTDGKEEIKKNNRLKGLKVTPLSEMSNGEINKIMEDMRKNPWRPQQYDDKQLMEEIFKRIGADEELAKMSAENRMVNKMWACHRTGKLVTLEDGSTSYHDVYTNEDGTYTTTIKHKDGVIKLDNPQYCDYYRGEMDARPTNKIRISKSELGGITLSSHEKDTADKFESWSKVEYNSNNIEMLKIKEVNGGIGVSIVVRNGENPFALTEIYKNKDENTQPFTREGYVNPKLPDKLYSDYFDYTNQETVDVNDIDFRILKLRNPKAAQYFEKFGDKDEQETVVGEE